MMISRCDFSSSSPLSQVYPGPISNIDEAIQAAVSCVDTIVMSPGIYTDCVLPVSLDKNVTIQAAGCIIDCNSQGIAFKTTATSSGASIRSIQIENAQTGIVHGGGDLLLDSVTIDNCVSAVYVGGDTTSLTILTSKFTNNDYEAIIVEHGATVKVFDTYFFNNTRKEEEDAAIEISMLF